MEVQTHAATTLMSRLLIGLSQTTLDHADDTPDFSADAIEETAPGVLTMKVYTPTGDAYRITVEWLSDESP